MTSNTRTDSLFAASEQKRVHAAQPLAARLRPRNLAEFVGQDHFLGPGKLLRRLIEADRLGSVIFYGPPGTGKTTLARLLASHSKACFRNLNAAASTVKEVRGELQAARDRLETTATSTLLFIDELHRFNRAQQDVLLPDVENGIVNLVGATTENPFFTINSPLVSRSQIFQFEPLAEPEILALLNRALSDPRGGFDQLNITLEPDAAKFLAQVCDGDARRALNGLEIAVRSIKERPIVIDLKTAEESIQRKAIVYDGTGDDHYDVASAFIKSMRGSDPDAAIYWLARMLEAGEDPRFIARRIVICASEDVGNADPMALVVANAAAQATQFIGMPECQLNLAQAVTYIAAAPKSNASTAAISAALKDVRHNRTLEVPNHLKDAHYPGAKQLQHGEGYQYAHDYPDGWVEQEYLPTQRTYYVPTERGFEAKIKKSLDRLHKRSKMEG